VKIPALILILLTIMMDNSKMELDSISEKYVRLSLSMGQHDPDYVDAYFGPPEWKQEAQTKAESLNDIRDASDSLIKAIAAISRPQEEMEALRYDYLKRQIESLKAFAEIKLGKKLSFDEESRALYDAVSPHLTENHFAKLVKELDGALPGEGSIQTRYETFLKDFIIPKEKVDSVFRLALAEARKRTGQYISLPPGESFTIEYVTNKPWSGYNWYQGNYRSVIQINTDLPIYINRAIGLAGHEGYPGHHVYNVLLEEGLLRKRKWIEFSIYPLHSSQSLIAEGSANYGVEILFPENERVRFEQKVLFPAAGLDPSRAATYYKIEELVEKLNYAGNEAARRLLDGEWDDEQAVQWLMKYSLSTREKATQRLTFIRKYRSYVINYNLGKDLVAKYIESRSNTSEQKWKELARLLGSPRLPSGLQ
jgi:hypothetical protein